MRIITTSILLASLVATGCADGKPAVSDDFTSIQADVAKTSTIAGTSIDVLGALSYGQTSAEVAYSKKPTYRAFSFEGSAGDRLDVWVSSDDGDAVAWVTDDHFNVLAMNDDADPTTTDAHVQVTLAASDAVTHYVVFREYDHLKSHFTVELDGQNTDLACRRDADCAAIEAPACCPNGLKVAIAAADVDAYDAANACTARPQSCPLALIHDPRVAKCDRPTKQCVLVAPAN